LVPQRLRHKLAPTGSRLRQISMTLALRYPQQHDFSTRNSISKAFGNRIALSYARIRSPAVSRWGSWSSTLRKMLEGWGTR
jgi:hypothetical protein